MVNKKIVKSILFFKSICILAIPIIIENIFQTLLGTIDTYFAGKLNDSAIAAISSNNLIMNIYIAFYAAVSIGATSVISRYYGKKEKDKIHEGIRQAILIALIIGIVIGLVSIVFYKPILLLVNKDKLTLEYSIPYYFVVIVPSIIICFITVISACLRAIKNFKISMYVTGISNIINIFLNIIFMKLGIGIVGLALATTISRLIAMVVLFRELINKTDKKIFSKEKFRINKEIIKNILVIGIPAGVERLIMRIGQLVYNSMIISLGTVAYVAHNIGGTIENYSYIPALGFGMAIASLIGISIGEDDMHKAESQTLITYIITALYMSIVGVGIYIYADRLSSIFTETREIQIQVATVIRFIAFFQPFSALTQIMINALQGAGDTRYPMYVTMFGIWGIRVVIGYILAVICNMGLMGAWVAYALDITFRGVILAIRFKSGKWKSIKIA